MYNKTKQKQKQKKQKEKFEMNVASGSPSGWNQVTLADRIRTRSDQITSNWRW